VEPVGIGTSAHLPVDHLDPVDVAFHTAEVPLQAQPGSDGVLVAAQTGNESAQLGGSQPFLQSAAAAFSDQLHVRLQVGKSGEMFGDRGQLVLVRRGKAVGLLMI
jgi:hypothetical protein